MAHAKQLDLSRDVIRLDEGAATRAALLAGVGLAAIVLGLFFGGRSGWDVFFRSYLLNWSFAFTIVMGALFFVMLQHLTRAGWSVSVRRLAEFVMGTMPLMAILFVPMLIPVMLGMEGVYKWSSAAVVEKDPLLQHKAAYLSTPFFIIRMLVYFGLWIFLARYFLGRSLEQDRTGDPQLTLAMDRTSAWAMLAYAISFTFFSIDALMSLNPHWFSTIFGVYIFSGSVVGFFATLALIVVALQRSGRLTHAISVEHFHDIGKLMFGFIVFWAYIKFSQYMLIWYANLPEETVWYLPRQGDTWWIGVSLLLLFGHFVAPFLALLSRFPKRRPWLLTLGAAWMLLMHWVDLYYIVIPRPHGFGPAVAPLHATDVLLLVGMACLLVAGILWQMRGRPLVPERDPRLHESLSFENI